VTVLDCYRTAPRRARLHVRARWRSCPFDAVADAVPTAGRILDLGCGHGLFTLHLALGATGRRLVGVDIDAAKLAVAEAAGSACAPAVAFRLGTAAEVPAGPWEAVTVLDVLYLLDAAAQHRIVTDAAAQLVPGGVLVVKEMSRTPHWKFLWNRVQELLAVRVLRITAGHAMTFAPDDALPAWMAEAGLDVVTDRRVDKGYLHPHRLVVGRRPVG
jgi:2-polyprenyl-3-methyl-5-hydroxy-6-metoxy-1,4-benzoquinol methylase